MDSGKAFLGRFRIRIRGQLSFRLNTVRQCTTNIFLEPKLVEIQDKKTIAMHSNSCKGTPKKVGVPYVITVEVVD